MSLVNPSQKGDIPCVAHTELVKVSAKLEGLGSMLEQNRQSVLDTEARMVAVVDRLADRLEKTTDRMGDLLQDQSKSSEERNDKIEARVARVEGRYSVVAAFSAFAVVIMPLIAGFGVWAYDRQIRLDPDEVLELRLQLDDLERHKRLGGRGSFWISPDRRLSGSNGNPPAAGTGRGQ